MLDAIKMAGWTGWLLVLVGVVGALTSLACVGVAAVKRDARVSFWMAALPMLVATAAFGLGIVGMALGRHKVHQALGGVAAIAPSEVEWILHEGFREARSNVRIGLVAGALPFVLGLVAMVLGFVQPKRGGGAIAIVATLVASATAAACFVANAQPLPGRDFALAESGERDLYDAHALLARGEDDLGCVKLVDGVRDRRELRAALESGERTAPLPDLGAILKIAPDFLALTARCGERLVAGIERSQDRALNAKRLVDFRTLEPAIELDTRAKLRARVDAAFAPPAPSIGLGDWGLGDVPSSGGAAGSPGPKVRQGAITVTGRLPPEVIQRIVRQSFGRFRLCYESGLKSDPKLAGTVTTTFVIGKDGTVASVAEDPGTAAGALRDARVRSCVARAFRTFAFPQPEGGVVNVSYPVRFAPAE